MSPQTLFTSEQSPPAHIILGDIIHGFTPTPALTGWMRYCNCRTSVYSLNLWKLPGHFSYSLGMRLGWCNSVMGIPLHSWHLNFDPKDTIWALTCTICLLINIFFVLKRAAELKRPPPPKPYVSMMLLDTSPALPPWPHLFYHLHVQHMHVS